MLSGLRVFRRLVLAQHAALIIVRAGHRAFGAFVFVQRAAFFTVVVRFRFVSLEGVVF